VYRYVTMQMIITVTNSHTLTVIHKQLCRVAKTNEQFEKFMRIVTWLMNYFIT